MSEVDTEKGKGRLEMIPKIFFCIASYLLFDALKSKKGGNGDEADSKDGGNRANRGDRGQQHRADSANNRVSGLNVIQIKNPKTGLYTAINIKKGKVTAHKKTPGPWKGIKIIKGKKDEKFSDKRKSDALTNSNRDDIRNQSNTVCHNGQTEGINREGQATINDNKGELKSEHENSVNDDGGNTVCDVCGKLPCDCEPDT